MGFHKRFISEDLLIGHYREYGIDGVTGLWSADAIITSDDLSHDVSDILCSDVLTNDEKLELAGLMVAMASIRKEANEAKNKKTTITS
jgi:hypothetical protein|tara:strand:+ start:513 stop:776 length:264 start_codon:yes stop_codon:yes gene_type:complete